MAAELIAPGDVTVAAKPVAPGGVVVEPDVVAVEEDELVVGAGRPVDPQAASPDPRTTAIGSASASALSVRLIHMGTA